jgi:hypothetical protein
VNKLLIEEEIGDDKIKYKIQLRVVHMKDYQNFKNDNDEDDDIGKYNPGLRPSLL